jgi:hypothetical protein
MTSINIYEDCIVCGESSSIDYGYRISWGLKELDKGGLTDERFFCSLECMRRWISELYRNGTEELVHSFESNVSSSSDLQL